MEMKKRILTMMVLCIAFLTLIVVAVWYLFGLTPATISSTPVPSIQWPSLPPNSPPPPTSPTTIPFTFDSGSPALLEGQNIPFYQTSGGVTAYFSSYPDPVAFSIQSYDTTFYKLSQFTGNYLLDNTMKKNSLDIRFKQPLTDITLTFATVEYHGVGEVDEPSILKVTAYMNSTGITTIGSATSRGNFSSNLYPQGILSFHSNGRAFNQVTIELPVQKGATTEFYVDNIIVTTAPFSNN